MLRISKLADYGTVIMNHLALNPERVYSASEIAQQIRLGKKVPTVSKILKILLEAGLVSSVRGKDGGYHLAMPAEKISLAQVIAAIDGSPGLTECCYSNRCEQDASCAVKDNWKTVNRFIFTTLQSLTLADMSKPLMMHPICHMMKEMLCKTNANI
jgi:FeS assembly SUF system regulator